MITPEYLAGLPDEIIAIFQGLEDYVISDIARRIHKMGIATSTAEIQRIALEALGQGVDSINNKIAEALEITQDEVQRIFAESTQIATDHQANLYKAVGIKQDLAYAKQLGQAMSKAAMGDLHNLTRTTGYIMNNGQFSMLADAYRQTLGFAQAQILSGSVDYSTAIRNAMKPFVSQGLTSVGYRSGVKRSIEAATRQCILQGTRDTIRELWARDAEIFGADGWELSAHANCAPDHEPYQGRQYSLDEYEELNNSLERPIGRYNCHHVAFPILLDISEPTYSNAELEAMKKANADGVTYEGKHYTGYQAQQMQRKLERAIRKTKRELIEYDKGRLKDDFTTGSIKLRRQRELYSDFSKKAGLLERRDLTQTAGYGHSMSGKHSMQKGNNHDN